MGRQAGVRIADLRDSGTWGRLLMHMDGADRENCYSRETGFVRAWGDRLPQESPQENLKAGDGPGFPAWDSRMGGRAARAGVQIVHCTKTHRPAPARSQCGAVT